jgi:hypothetical protein
VLPLALVLFSAAAVAGRRLAPLREDGGAGEDDRLLGAQTVAHGSTAYW